MFLHSQPGEEFGLPVEGLDHLRVDDRLATRPNEPSRFQMVDRLDVRHTVVVTEYS